MNSVDEKRFVIACDSDFIITEIITIKNIEISLGIHDPVSKIFSHDNVPKFSDFTLTLRIEKAIFGCEMSIVDDNHSITIMNFGGIRLGNNYIIIAFSNCLGFYEELMKINNEHINLLREKLKTAYVSPDNYQKFAELNNEIINMQRELYQKNAYVLDLLNKKQEMINT